MVSVSTNNKEVLANNFILWDNGTFTPCDEASANTNIITLGRCGLYSIDFDASIQTAAADTSIALSLAVNGITSNIGDIVSTAAVDTPVHSGFNTVLRVSSAPVNIGVITDSDITVNKAQLKAVHL